LTSAVVEYPDDPLRTFPMGDPHVRRAEFGHVAVVRLPAYDEARVTGLRAQLTSTERDYLPDSAFAFIEPSGAPWTARGRRFPGRCGTSRFMTASTSRTPSPGSRRAQLGEQARPKVEAAARRFGIRDYAEDKPGQSEQRARVSLPRVSGVLAARYLGKGPEDRAARLGWPGKSTARAYAQLLDRRIGYQRSDAASQGDLELVQELLDARRG
jgi:hypothetical protein